MVSYHRVSPWHERSSADKIGDRSIDPIMVEEQLPATAPFADRVRVIACGAIAREVIAVCKANKLDHVDLVCLPAIWHVYPEKIAPATREAIRKAREEGYQRIFIGYAECGTQGQLDKICAEEGMERMAVRTAMRSSPATLSSWQTPTPSTPPST